MVDRPIIFSTPMVRAQYEGRKTNTRRFAWGPRLQPALTANNYKGLLGWKWAVWHKGECAWPTSKALKRMGLAPDADQITGFMAPSNWQKVRPGDRLWVKENAWICPPGWTDTPANPMGPNHREVAYQADDRKGGTAEAAADYKLKLRPSIHMPRWASRLTLTVTAVKIEPLNAISEANAKAEGLEHRLDYLPQWRGAPDLPWCSEFPRDAFADLWRAIHGPKAWEANPDVVALTFTVEQRNIDAKAAA